MSLTEHDNQSASPGGSASGGGHDAKQPNKELADGSDHVPAVRPSLVVRMIRHAESMNNQVYRNARYLYRGGCPDFDSEGWTKYVDAHRLADPPLSDVGIKQSHKLAEFLVPHLTNQASSPVRIISSPMRRTLETIRPTLNGLLRRATPTNVIVHGYYFESEGCHVKERAEEGMNPDQISRLLREDNSAVPTTSDGGDDAPVHSSSVEFVGFPNMERGWYVNGTSSETREEAEERAARFYLWLMELLDQELLEASSCSSDVFDAGVAVEGEDDNDNEHDCFAPRRRRRRTTLLVGHGDFMSLVLKRVVAGFCHAIEQPGTPHRSAFVHYNTGITDLEYFGNGRWLLMSHNATPHFGLDEYRELRSGGSLKDGWSYLVPNLSLDAEVSVAFCDEDDLEDHVKEQAQALKALYLSSRDSRSLGRADSQRSVSPSENGSLSSSSQPPHASPSVSDVETAGRDSVKHFIVKRGMQVVGVAAYSDRTGLVTDVAVRPSAGKHVGMALFDAVKSHSRKLGRSGSLLVFPRSRQSKALFEELGFVEMSEAGAEHISMELSVGNNA
jgi:broad specificity phosphatase PhoE